MKNVFVNKWVVTRSVVRKSSFYLEFLTILLSVLDFEYQAGKYYYSFAFVIGNFGSAERANK